MKHAALVLALCASACATGTRSTVNVAGGWPEAPAPYDAAHARWTRHDKANADFVQAIDAFATLESPEWRAAYAAERAKRLALPAEDAKKLADEERAAGDKAWEIVLLVSTYKPAWNDLNKPVRSMWRVALAGDEGREVVATTIREDKRPREVLAQYFPDITEFHRAYIVTFPKTTTEGAPLVSGDGSRLVLKIASAVARVEMVWGK
jgi:hypothetical protein